MISAADIITGVRKVTKKWTQQREAEKKGLRTRSSRQYVYSDRVNFTDVADRIIPAGYLHASGNGKYPVDNRQFYYACRDEFREATGREITADYFSQTLLVQYMNRHPRETASWKITASPRGTLTIPNTGHDWQVPCGTLAIEEQLVEAARPVDVFSFGEHAIPAEWPSRMEGQRYQAVLYIEKEGFEPQLKEAQIAERFDIAIISCKGQSVTAARRFVDHVCRVNGGVPLFVVHDFDPSGFSICSRLTTVSSWARKNDLVKYEFKNKVNVTDFGLRLEDVEKYSLKPEQFQFRTMPQEVDATDEERAFFRSGRRVELNAFTAPQFIEWIEAKLSARLSKFVPADDVLESAYQRAFVVATLNDAIEKAKAEATEKAKTLKLPKGIRERLAKGESPWDLELYEQAVKLALSRGTK